MRTFIAVELEPALKRPLIKLLREVLPGHRDIRWCTENQLHVTLKFLGEVRDDQVTAVCAIATQVSAAIAPFPLRVRGLGCFPGPANPRVLWCGVDDPSGGCRRWVEMADPLLGDLGFARENRAYTPHITLGRGKSTAGGRVFQEVLKRIPPPETEQMTVRQVIVYESRLLPTGAQYRPMATVPLGGQAE